MFKTKVTTKGQITLPSAYREKLHLSRGSVVVLDLGKDEIFVRKPKSKLEELFGVWSDMTDEDIRRIRAVWRGWNGKSIPRF